MNPDYVFDSVAQCCGFGMFIPDPAFFHPGSASKNLSILTQKSGLNSRKYYMGCSSWIPDPDADFLPIPDPGVKRPPDPGTEGQCCIYGSWIRDEQPVSYFLELRPFVCVKYLN
jgi:hypothetical protein